MPNCSTNLNFIVKLSFRVFLHTAKLAISPVCSDTICPLGVLYHFLQVIAREPTMSVKRVTCKIVLGIVAAHCESEVNLEIVSWLVGSEGT